MQVGRYRDMMANEHITIHSNSYEKVKILKYQGYLLSNQNSTQEKIKYRLKAGNSCYYSVHTRLSSRLLSKKLQFKMCKTIIISCAFFEYFNSILVYNII